jgi:hypothetical protein
MSVVCSDKWFYGMVLHSYRKYSVMQNIGVTLGELCWTTRDGVAWWCLARYRRHVELIVERENR